MRRALRGHFQVCLEEQHTTSSLERWPTWYTLGQILAVYKVTRFPGNGESMTLCRSIFPSFYTISCHFRYRAVLEFSANVTKHCHCKQRGEENVHLACASSVTTHPWGKSGQNLKAGTWRQDWSRAYGRRILTGLLPHGGVSCFLIQPKATYPGAAQPTVSWVLQNHHQARKCLTDLTPGQSVWISLPDDTLFSLRTRACIELTKD